jgi:5-methylthioadenosine/S-adenosylhomocysteine deaminase
VGELTIAETLAIATLGSAQVFGLPNDLGQLAPGFLADLILVDMTGAHNQPLYDIPANLVYATRASDVQTVIVNGEIIMRDRRLLTLNKAEIIEQVKQSMTRLSRRVPEQRVQHYKP